MALFPINLGPTRTLERCDVIKVMNDRFVLESSVMTMRVFYNLHPRTLIINDLVSCICKM